MQNQSLKQQLDQSNKIINFLQQKFVEQTGHEVNLPQTWQQFLNVDDSKAPILEQEQNNKGQQQLQNNENEQVDEYQIEKQEKEPSFLQAIINLDLPVRSTQQQNTKKNPNSMQSKKGPSISTSFNPSNPHHMVEIINLSNFATRSFNKASFKELLSCIKDMRCLHSLVLQNNGIDDTYLEELDILFNMQRVKKIDLSQNFIGKKGGTHIARMLKDQVQHIEWIDVSRNNFSTEVQVLQLFSQGFKKQPNLYHFCIDTNTHQAKASSSQESLTKLVASDSFIKLVKESSGLSSFGLIDSQFTIKSMQVLAQYLASAQCTLTGINLKYCFLSLPLVFDFGKGLARNRSLVKLDLSSNALDPIAGIYISRAIKENVFLAELNVAKNNLSDGFAEHLSESLKINQTLWKCEIHGNPIGQLGAENLLTVLHEDNETLESLGDVSASNTAMGVLHIQLLNKALKVNSVSKDVRAKLIEQQRNRISDDPKDITIKQTDFEQNQTNYESEFDHYKLSKPILFTNDPYYESNDFQVWNI